MILKKVKVIVKCEKCGSGYELSNMETERTLIKGDTITVEFEINEEPVCCMCGNGKGKKGKKK